MGEEQQLPEYICHKRVRAAKILLIATIAQYGAPSVYLLHRAGDGNADEHTRYVDSAWMRNHNLSPEGRGGYFVEYADGYTSWSPTQAFEAGYTRVGAEV